MKSRFASTRRKKGSPTVISPLLFHFYRIDNNRLRKLILSLTRKLENDDFCSQTLRRLFSYYHKVEIGMYTHGGCFELSHIDPYTKIGRYCSIASEVRVFNQNHPLNFKSTHGFFFNPVLKFCDDYLANFIPLEIGNDVWIGCRAIIMPNVRRICDGAVIAAGAVVNKDVPPYAIVCGNPARVVRYRFSQGKIKELLESRWWEKPIEDLQRNREDYLQPLEEGNVDEDSVGGQ